MPLYDASIGTYVYYREENTSTSGDNPLSTHEHHIAQMQSICPPLSYSSGISLCSCNHGFQYDWNMTNNVAITVLVYDSTPIIEMWQKFPLNIQKWSLYCVERHIMDNHWTHLAHCLCVRHQTLVTRVVALSCKNAFICLKSESFIHRKHISFYKLHRCAIYPL